MQRTPPTTPGQHQQDELALPSVIASTKNAATTSASQGKTDSTSSTSPLKKRNKAIDGKPTHFGSEPNLSTLSDAMQNITTRNASKRLRRESGSNEIVTSPLRDDVIKSMITSQDTKLDAIMEFMRDMKSQINGVQDSLEFMSHKYEEILGRLHSLEQERKEEKKYIQTLEKKIEYLEKNNRITDIEIKNIPANSAENKIDLLNILKKTGEVLSVQIEQRDVRNIYRVSTAVPSNKPIIVEFNDILKKDEVMKSVKAFNKRHPSNKLNTSHLSLHGPQKPVFITESLTFKTKKLYAMARDFAKTRTYKYCWTSRGAVYLRLKEGDPAVRINDEEDLVNLKS